MTRWLTTLPQQVPIRTIDDGGYYEADAEGTEGEEGADAANSMVDEEEPENGTVPAEEPVEAEEKQGSAGDDVNPSQADGVVYLG